MAGRCAAQQDAFWPLHDKLFATHGQEWGGEPRRDRKVFAEFATELGLDTAAFDQCLSDPSVTQAVRQELTLALQVGIRSTPTFLINGRPLIGAQPFESFQQAIELVRREH